MQLAVNMGFAHTAGDKLGNLRTEVENEDFCLGSWRELCRVIGNGLTVSKRDSDNKTGRLKTADYTIFRRPLQ